MSKNNMTMSKPLIISMIEHLSLDEVLALAADYSENYLPKIDPSNSDQTLDPIETAII